MAERLLTKLDHQITRSSGAGRLSQNPNVAVTSHLALPLGNFKPHPMATWDVLDTLPNGAGELPLHTLGPLQYLASPEIWVDGIYRCGEHHGIPLSIFGIFRNLTAGGAGRGGRQKVHTHKVLHFLRSLQQPMASLTPLEPEYPSRALVLEVGLRSLAHPHPPEPEPT